MTAAWQDSDNFGMVDYADKDELVTYSVTVRTSPLVSEQISPVWCPSRVEGS